MAKFDHCISVFIPLLLSLPKIGTVWSISWSFCSRFTSSTTREQGNPVAMLSLNMSMKEICTVSITIFTALNQFISIDYSIRIGQCSWLFALQLNAGFLGFLLLILLYFSWVQFALSNSESYGIYQPRIVCSPNLQVENSSLAFVWCVSVVCVCHQLKQFC